MFRSLTSQTALFGILLTFNLLHFKVQLDAWSGGVEQVAPVAKQEVIGVHPRMSCYACTTMDYESSTDNICRSLRPHINRSPQNLHYQGSTSMHFPSASAGSHMHFSQQNRMSAITASTSTSTMAATSESDHDEPTNSVLISSEYSDTVTTPANYMASPSTLHSTGDSKYVNGSSTTLAPYSASTEQAQRARASNNRTMLPSNYIRTRPCMEDENFCSIVSVVRIEFVQDNIYSKFWALERNCSKSCNTGCMVIGERVRLRVCSQCCRTPNCNVGSGAYGSSLAAIEKQWPLAYIMMPLVSAATVLSLSLASPARGAI